MKEIIGRTMIGSHIWKMNHKDSDKDYFEIYSEDIYDILSHVAKYKSTFKQSNGIDVHSHEVSHVVNQVLKGNINFVIGVLSPIIVVRTDEFISLRDLVRRTISKNIYHSIHGMTTGNYIKYIQKADTYTEHKCNQILRAIEFGIKVLQKGKLEFKPYTNGSPDEILEKLSELEYSYLVSPLKESPPENSLRTWLLFHRIGQLDNKR